MALESRNVSKNASFAKEPIQFAVGTTSVSQAGTTQASMTVPYPFQVVSVEVFATGVTATATVDVQIGATSALTAQITPVAGSKVAGVLSATAANTRSAASGGVLSLKYTTNASGVITNGIVTVWIRPYGMKGDPTPLIGESA